MSDWGPWRREDTGEKVPDLEGRLRSEAGHVILGPLKETAWTYLDRLNREEREVIMLLDSRQGVKMLDSLNRAERDMLERHSPEPGETGYCQGFACEALGIKGDDCPEITAWAKQRGWEEK